MLVPSTVPGWPGMLREATAGHLQSEGARAALASAMDSDIEDGSLFFGAVEQFAGLERAFVLAIGFFHPRNRLARRGSAAERRGRVDPAVYQALTRCTFRLVVLEVGVRLFAEHFELPMPLV